MQLSYLAVVDIFFRFAAVGMTALLVTFYLCRRVNLQTMLGASFSISLVGFILLTAPIANSHYGALRGLFLTLTELCPYFLWAWSMSLLDDHFKPQQWPKWRFALIATVILWFCYFFGVNEGRGVLHDVNHVIEGLVLLHILLVTLKGFNDDLVDSRRTTRKIFIIGVNIYLIFIISLELIDAPLRDFPIFSVSHALLFVLSIWGLSVYLFRHAAQHINELEVFNSDAPFLDAGNVERDNNERLLLKSDTNNKPNGIPLVFAPEYKKLLSLMESGGFQATGLTITSLAEQLALPEHQLRMLINRHMGFRNFSEFLNSYRIPAACQQLADTEQLRKPILTIALELGYGSVGPFNRAFKQQMGKTPKEFRQQFQN
ncbi:helix-turn-helix domain-containing protein [Thalassotalea fusca]